VSEISSDARRSGYVGLVIGVTAFVGYNLCSFHVLSQVDTVTHGTLSVMKRLFLIGWALFMRPHTPPLNATQGTGLIVANAGLAVYFAARYRESHQHRRFWMGTLGAMLIASLIAFKYLALIGGATLSSHALTYAINAPDFGISQPQLRALRSTSLAASTQ